MAPSHTVSRRGFFGALAGLVLVRPASVAANPVSVAMSTGGIVTGSIVAGNLLHGSERVIAMGVLDAIEQGGPLYAKFRKLASR